MECILQGSLCGSIENGVSAAPSSTNLLMLRLCEVTGHEGPHLHQDVRPSDRNHTESHLAQLILRLHQAQQQLFLIQRLRRVRAEVRKAAMNTVFELTK